MTPFLLRDPNSPQGIVEFRPVGGLLPKSASECYVPWALTGDQRVVYAKMGEHRSIHAWLGQTRLRPYDTTVSQDRRRLAESELGAIALREPFHTQIAVEKVSKGVREFLVRHSQKEAMAAMKKEIGHYFFTGGSMGFGRISEAAAKDTSDKTIWMKVLTALESGDLSQKLAIHDAVGRKLLTKLGGPEEGIYAKWGRVLRQDWFDDEKRRGRAKAPNRAAPTVIAGIAPDSGEVGTVNQSRNRGVDMFVRDTKRTREPAADDYYDDLDTRNLLFGAGISGTTGSLLQSAFAFGKLQVGEDLKQYTLAIIGYLVGGGMHSYHESMAVAAKAGVPYKPGGYLDSLPLVFTQSMSCKNWQQKYYDVVMMGGLHWRYNGGAAPSHMNPNLVTPPK